MSKLQFYADRLGVYHILFGAFIYFPLFFINDIVALTAVSFFYLGRERRDYEIKKGIPVRKWYTGWNVLDWCVSDLIVIPFYVMIATIWRVYGV